MVDAVPSVSAAQSPVGGRKGSVHVRCGSNGVFYEGTFFTQPAPHVVVTPTRSGAVPPGLRDGSEVSPNDFQRLCGRSQSKNWKKAMYVVVPDDPSRDKKTLEQWLELEGYSKRKRSSLDPADTTPAPPASSADVLAQLRAERERLDARISTVNSVQELVTSCVASVRAALGPDCIRDADRLFDRLTSAIVDELVF